MFIPPKNHRELPVFRVTYENGISYISSMAKGVTLEQARDYWLGQFIEQSNGKMLKIVSVDVEPQV